MAIASRSVGLHAATGQMLRNNALVRPQIRLSEAIGLIKSRMTDGAFDVEGICELSIREDVPLVCTALHDGAGFPTRLEEKCLLSPVDRRFEEDPHTLGLLASLPIVLAGRESRYYYDLNRPPEEATRNLAFGRETWRAGEHPAHPLALTRHQKFYRLAGALIEALISQHGSCLVLDLHAYNGSKIPREAPVFNLGTSCVDTNRHRLLLDTFLHGLSQIVLPDNPVSVAENDVFQGRGYFVNWVQTTFPEAIPLCLEVKKIYCDEKTGQLDETLFLALQNGLEPVIRNLYPHNPENPDPLRQDSGLRNGPSALLMASSQKGTAQSINLQLTTPASKASLRGEAASCV